MLEGEQNSTAKTMDSNKTPKETIFGDFHPVWFISFMGTGICASVLFKFPYEGEWLRVCGYIMWGISLSLFFITTSMFIGKAIWFSETMADTFTNPTSVVFFGAYSMGWSTVVNMTHFVTDGKWALGVWVFWWINVLLALLCGWILVFVMFTKSKFTEQSIQGTLILPVLPLTVSAASGSLLVQTLPTANLQIMTITITFMMWSQSICLGFSIIAIYLWRLVLYKIPPAPMMFTTWVPIGLLAQGGWGILNNGLNVKNYMSKFSQYKNREMIGEFAHAASFVIGLFLISFGIVLSALAVWTSLYRGKTPFTKTWWAMTFPIGAMAVCCNEFRSSFDGFGAFRVLAAIYGVACILSVIGCLIGSIIWEFPRTLLRKNSLK